jgi:hypothetical protein
MVRFWVAFADHLAVTDVLGPDAAGEGDVVTAAKGWFSVAARGVQLPVRLVEVKALMERRPVVLLMASWSSRGWLLPDLVDLGRLEQVVLRV